MKRPAAPLALAFAFALSAVALSACGGGGGTAASAMAPAFQIDRGAARTLTRATAPTESAADQTARRAGILARTDSIVASTLYGGSFSSALSSFALSSSCTGTACRFGEPTSGANWSVRLSDLEFASPGWQETEARTRAVLSKNGVTLLEYAGENLRAYYAWMEHSGFVVQRENGFVSLYVGRNPSGGTIHRSVPASLRHGMAGGDLTGSRPSVNATWTGVMVGTPAQGGPRNHYLQGDASLTYATAGNRLNAAFSNIVNLNTGRAHSTTSLSFNNVPVTAGGTFASGTGGNRIQGGLYGPDHAEATGVFKKNDIVGAFGARKEP